VFQFFFLARHDVLLVAFYSCMQLVVGGQEHKVGKLPPAVFAVLRRFPDHSAAASSTQTKTSTPPNHNEPIRRGSNHTVSSKASTPACSRAHIHVCATACMICCCYVQMMSKVAHEWRDHEGAQRYASTAVVCFVHNKPKTAHPKSQRKKPPITTQQQTML
jgi:hypothetical protein